MYLDALFLACIGVIYLEPALSRVFGKLLVNCLVLLSTVGICSVIAVLIVDAL